MHPVHASCARALEDGPFNQARDHVYEEELALLNPRRRR